MRKAGWIIAFTLITTATASAQVLRNSLLQYQFNALSINPAYAARLPYTGFEGIYFGNFSSENLISRSAQASLQGPTANGGLGLNFQFYRTQTYGELNFQPAYARQFVLESGGEIAFGLTLGVNYFDLDESFFNTIQSDFATIDGGFGIYYHNQRYFAGISALHLFEEALGLQTDNSGNSVWERENPYYLHLGGVFRVMEDIALKPVALLKYANIYELSDAAGSNDKPLYTGDLQLNVIIEDTYVVGILRGYSNPSDGSNKSRTGLSFTYMLGNFRLTYAIQHNSISNSSVSLPFSHMIGAGYDFVDGGEEEGGKRYF